MPQKAEYIPQDGSLAKRWRTEFDSWIGGSTLGYQDTLSKIRDEGLSFSRFGDGEMLLASKADFNLGFQENSSALRKELDKILLNLNDNLLVGMSPFWRNEHWDKVFVEVWPHMRELVPQQPTIYGSAYVTRSAAFWKDKQGLVDAWRSVWDARKVVIVAGRRSRFELVPELFDNVKNVELFESEPVNAYKDIPRLVSELSSRKDSLVLLSLGAAATVLASKLSEVGVQALDVGHISNCYNNVFNGGPTPEKLPRIAPLGAM